MKINFKNSKKIHIIFFKIEKIRFFFEIKKFEKSETNSDLFSKKKMKLRF